MKKKFPMNSSHTSEGNLIHNNNKMFVCTKQILTQNADHVGLHDRLAQLLIDGVAGDHLVPVVGVDDDGQRGFSCPATIRTRCLRKK
jgi:hypothetical protein